MKKIKVNLFVLILVFTMIVTSFEVPVSAMESKQEETDIEESEDLTTDKAWDGKTKKSIYQGEGYTVTFDLTGSWSGGYNASVRIDNTSELPIENWKIQIDYEGKITDAWNAELKSNKEGKYTIKNAGWNQDIAAGSYIEFGLSGQEDFQGFPTSYKMLGEKNTAKKEDYTVEYQIQDDWQTGFTGMITITNKTENTIEDWILEFDSKNKITDIWDAVIESHDDEHYVIKNCDYRSNIAAGKTVSFGFKVDQGSSAEKFAGFVLRHYSEVEKASDKEKEPLESIGEVYCKKTATKDIVYDKESGVQYVKNQLLISAYMGAEKSIFETIAKEVGAEIVGYIELTNDYQIEFKEDKSLEELKTIAADLNSLSFVSNVTLNYCIEMMSTMATNDTYYNDGKTCYDNKGTCFDIPGDDWNEENPSGDNWGLEALRVPSAWDYDAVFHTVKVGVYDEGFINDEHEDLEFDDVVNNKSEDIKKLSHGTHVAGIIGAKHNNGKGISGVATDVRLYAYGREDDGSYNINTMEEKIAYGTLIGNDVKVINVSMGTDDVIAYAASHGSAKAQNYIQKPADALAEYFNKLVMAGYDFVICTSAGNANDKEFVKNEHFIKDDEDLLSGLEYREPKEGDKDKESGEVYALYNNDLTAITDVNLKKRIIVVGEMKNDGNGNYSKVDESNIGVDFMAPGWDILSTVPKEMDSTGYALMHGTSMATPYVTGIAALMFQVNPAMKASLVKDYMSLSSQKYLEYDHVPYKIPDAVGCLEFAIHGSDNDEWPSGTVCGYTKKNGMGKVKALDDVQITALRTSTGEYNLGEYSFSFASDEGGYYTQKLPQGTYEFIVTKKGYLPYAVNNVVIEPGETTYLDDLILHPSTFSFFSKHFVQGNITDALKGTAVGNATVKLRKGWNQRTGEYSQDGGKVFSAKTDADGHFSMDVSIGAYTAEIEKDGYVKAFYNVISCEANEQNSAEIVAMVITPVLSDDEYRIILTWGDLPRDLDSHLTYYVNRQQKYHVYFGSKSGNYGGKAMASLDYDDTSSYGPETVTITLDTDSIKSGSKFQYSVHNYSSQGSMVSNDLSYSNATVHVYAGNNLIKTFHVPKDQIGTVWHVFDITENGIEAVNEFYNAYSGGVR